MTLYLNAILFYLEETEKKLQALDVFNILDLLFCVFILTILFVGVVLPL